MSSALLPVPSTVFPPTPTSGPDLIPEPTAFNLSKRADHIPSNICGWFSGSGYGMPSIFAIQIRALHDNVLRLAYSLDSKWIYNDPSVTCFWNSDAHFVGNAIPPQTACIGEAQWSTWSCSGSGCSSSVARWYVSASYPTLRLLVNTVSTISSTGTQPYCVTFSYGPNYLSFVCSEKDGIVYQMEPYWSGFSDPIAFPVYTGAKGVSTGTQYPAGYPTPSSTTSSSSSTNTNSNTASSTSERASGSSASPTSSGNHGSSTPVGAIVGGVIGGLALIGLITGVIVFVLLSRKKRPRQSQQPAPGFPQGPQRSAYQYPPANPAPIPYQGPPQSPPVQQSLRHEVETHYNKPELDVSRQQPEQAYLHQEATAPGMQPIQPEYVSMATQPSRAELASHTANSETNVISTGHQGKEGNIYEAP